MADIKHVGKLTTTGRKVLVAFRTLPGDAYNCLVVPTENLSDAYHDALIQLVESSTAQTANEFGEVLSRGRFPDGSIMLPALHTQRKLLKVPTDIVEMTPNFTTKIKLSELNQIIAEQRGVAVDDLAIKDSTSRSDVEVVEVATVKDISQNKSNDEGRTTSSSINEPEVQIENMSSEDRAKYFRSEADKLSKKAADMRRQAESLVPTKKKSTVES